MGLFSEKLSLAVGSYALSEESVNNWYYSSPRYAFKYRFEMGLSTMFLPINPENLTITTNYATNLHPTLYGTVEEHSETRYFNMSITGTTGIAPIGPKFPDHNRLRDSIKNESMGGRATSEADDDVGVYPHQSGYMAFHSLYRYLMRYKRDAANNNRNEPLFFYNYKDNNVYKVSLSNFQLVRSSDDPYIYRYKIEMTGYHLASINRVTEIADTIESVLTNTRDLGQYSDLIKGSNKIFKDVYRTTTIKGFRG
jgi:hypothetical protein